MKISTTSYYDEEGRPVDLTDKYSDEEWSIEDDAPAFSVLRKIIHDGYIRSGWSLRNGSPTIYGPYSAVCFTEMPLYALIEYAKDRGAASEYVGSYGIAFLRRELFDAGARPVIYGLSSQHKEADDDCSDPYYGRGGRCLSAKCGIGLTEQYRYVYTKLSAQKSIDWMHEREWRWPLFPKEHDLAGMPFLLSSEWGYQFSQIVIIVSEDDEQQILLDQLKNMYESKGRNCGIDYNMKLLPAIRVLSLETLERANVDFARIEDVPMLQANVRTKIPVTEEIRKKVVDAVNKSNDVYNDAIKVFYQQNPDYKKPDFNWGSARVYTCGNTEVTQALFDAGIASTFADGQYMFHVGQHIYDDMGLEIIGAEAAANFLSKELGQSFYVYELPD